MCTALKIKTQHLQDISIDPLRLPRPLPHPVMYPRLFVPSNRFCLGGLDSSRVFLSSNFPYGICLMTFVRFIMRLSLAEIWGLRNSVSGAVTIFSS